MATKVHINFENENGSSGPGNGIVYNADFLPNVGEFISFNGKSGVVRERKFALQLEGDNGVLLMVTASE